MRALRVLLVAGLARALQDGIVGRTDEAPEPDLDGPAEELCSDASGGSEQARPAPAEEPARSWPHLLPLQHSRIPVVQDNRTVSFKSVYFGKMAIGKPEQQEFKVIFDTGSAHAIVSSINCQEPHCLLHQRYNSSLSSTMTDINIDGSTVLPGSPRDTVTVGFGTGSVFADAINDVVCLGWEDASSGSRLCAETHMLIAREMSVLFETATFDGIVGLSFPKLALSSEFSFLSRLTRAMGEGAPECFAFFLADDDEGDRSELALGGWNPARLLTPLTYVPVTDPEQGHWTIAMHSVAVDGRPLEICADGGCQGIVDTGTSHLGVAKEDLRFLVELLSKPANETDNCRNVEGKTMVIEIDGMQLELSPREYMRQLPLRVGTLLNKDHEDEWVPVPFFGGGNGTVPMDNNTWPEDANESFTCTPRLFPVTLVPGKRIFLLGEPVLQKYYSVFDWGQERIGFGLADQRSVRGEDEAFATNGFDDSTLLQVKAKPTRHAARGRPGASRVVVSSADAMGDVATLRPAFNSVTVSRTRAPLSA